MVDWSEYVKHPSVTLILGDVGSGKTAVAANIVEYYHKEEIQVYMPAVPQGWPKWFKRCSLDAVPRDCALFLDDAHLLYYAREWTQEGNKTVDFIARQRRHNKNSIIYTTQQARVLDVNLVSMASCLIFRRPSLLQLEYERKELVRLFTEADKALASKGYDLDYSYIVCGRTKSLVETGDPPTWFDKEASEAVIPTPNEKVLGNPVFKFISGIGKAIG